LNDSQQWKQETKNKINLRSFATGWLECRRARRGKKEKMKTNKLSALLFGILIASLGQSFGQTNLQFTGINVTDEGNMHLAWASVSNEVYEIDEADALIDTNTGTTTWNLLYDNYPSQGTNTFWLDTGNYNLSPQILNPKDMPMRFYRIVDLGQDGLASDEPTVATGSGTSMLYNWDGTSNGTNLPNGIYYYYISAATNGESGDFVSGGSGGSGGGSPPSPDFARSSSLGSDASELWAVAPDSENVVPLALYPPGFDTNGFTIFSATPSEVASLTASSRPESTVALDNGGSFSPDASGGGSSASSQNSPATPQRPPNNPVRGLTGSFGICYDTYTGNGSSGYTLAPLDNGLHIGLDISMNNNSAGASLHYAPLNQYKAEANNFVSQMQHWGWNNTLLQVDKTLSINNLIGSGSPLNNVNLGVFMAHGAYGSRSVTSRVNCQTEAPRKLRAEPAVTSVRAGRQRRTERNRRSPLWRPERTLVTADK
jgi:hypothetical protein